MKPQSSFLFLIILFTPVVVCAENAIDTTGFMENQILITGPYNGVLKLPGSGNYIDRSTRILLRSVFTDQEMKQITALASIPENEQPSSAQIRLARRLAYVLLYYLRKDIQGAQYDSMTVDLSPIFSNLWGAYKWGPCSGGSFYLAQMLRSLGLPFFWMSMTGHTALAIKLGAGAVWFDSTFHTIHYFPDLHGLNKPGFKPSSLFKVTDKIFIDGWDAKDLDRYYGRLELPQNIENSKVILAKPELKGVPVSLPPDASLVLDYSGRETPYVLARFTYRLKQTPDQFHHTFIGRLHQIKIDGYMDAGNSYNPHAKPISVTGSLLAVDVDDYVRLVAPLTLHRGRQVTVDIDRLSLKSQKKGVRSGLVILKNLCTYNLLRGNKSKCAYTYKAMSSSTVQVEVLDSKNSVIAKKEFNGFTSRFILPFETRPERRAQRLRLLLTSASKPETLDLSNFTTSIDLVMKQERKHGINEYFPEGNPTRYYEGTRTFTGKAPLLPYGVRLNLEHLRKKGHQVAIQLDYRLSSTAFPFVLARSMGMGPQPAPNFDGIRWGRHGESLPPYHIRFSSLTKNNSGRTLAAFMLMDAAYRPVNDVRIVFPALFKTVFPITPYYSKDTSIPLLQGACHPNDNGVITLLADERRLLPVQICLLPPASDHRFVLKVPWEKE